MKKFFLAMVTVFTMASLSVNAQTTDVENQSSCDQTMYAEPTYANSSNICTGLVTDTRQQLDAQFNDPRTDGKVLVAIQIFDAASGGNALSAIVSTSDFDNECGSYVIEDDLACPGSMSDDLHLYFDDINGLFVIEDL